MSSSYALTASYALNGSGGSGGTQISCSWASASLYAIQAYFATQSLYATQSISASFATTASYVSASNVDGTVTSALYAVSASWVSASVHITNSDTASYFITSSVTSASYAISASWAPSTGGGSSVSSSWASSSLSSSYAPLGRSIVLCSAYTPVLLGWDSAETTIPFSPLDGSSSINWNVKRLSLRTQTIESATSSINIEYSTSTGSFNPTTIGGVTLMGTYEAATTGSLGAVASGNKLRFNVTTLGVGINWSIITEISNA